MPIKLPRQRRRETFPLPPWCAVLPSAMTDRQFERFSGLLVFHHFFRFKDYVLTFDEKALLNDGTRRQVDAVLTFKGDMRLSILVQAKQFRTEPVGIRYIDQYLTHVNSAAGHKLVLVSMHGFEAGVVETAKANDVTLISISDRGFTITYGGLTFSPVDPSPWLAHPLVKLMVIGPIMAGPLLLPTPIAREPSQRELPPATAAGQHHRSAHSDVGASTAAGSRIHPTVAPTHRSDDAPVARELTQGYNFAGTYRTNCAKPEALDTPGEGSMECTVTSSVTKCGLKATPNVDLPGCFIAIEPFTFDVGVLVENVAGRDVVTCGPQPQNPLIVDSVRAGYGFWPRDASPRLVLTNLVSWPNSITKMQRITSRQGGPAANITIKVTHDVVSGRLVRFVSEFIVSFTVAAPGCTEGLGPPQPLIGAVNPA
jgi:hypothetical protein